MLLVVDGPLKAYEVDLVQQFTKMEKRVLVCLNKEDWYDEQEQQQLIAQIAETVARNHAAGCRRRAGRPGKPDTDPRRRGRE